MVLPVPNLDDRTFQDIVNEARRRIPLYCPEWTDHNLSDPGITLIELFAWMTEMIIYRMNKVPDKNYVKFLELIGVELAPAASASTEVSFLLSASQPIAVTIPQGTEVSTVRTETEDAIEFTTLEDIRVEPADLQYLLVSDDGSEIDSPPNAEHAVDDDGAIRVPKRSLDLLDRRHSEVVWHEPAESTVPRSLLLRQAQFLDHCRDRQDGGQQFQGLHAVGTSALRVESGSWLSHEPRLAMVAWHRIRHPRIARLPSNHRP